MNTSLNVKTLEKAELHAHFNGCIPTRLIERLVGIHAVELPDGYELPRDLVIQSPVASLLDYFRPWFVFKRLPVGQECLDQMMLAAAESLSADGVRYAELRNSPFNIAEINGIGLERTLEWLVEAAEKASEFHPIDIRWIISFSRYNFDLQRAESLLSAINCVAHDQKIVGLDLSGDEDSPVNPEVSELFQRAKGDQGFGVTIHAGETGNIDNVLWAIEECRADRIGHCSAASEHAQVMELLTARDVCVEVCLQSNLLTNRCESLDVHPVHTFIANDVPFVLCSDNPQVHATPLSAEYELFVNATKRHDMVDAMYDTQRKYAFASL